jgi:iron complex outermembrane receptor protein
VHEGFEIEASGHVLENLILGGNYTYLERAIHTTGIVATDTPKHKLFAYATWTPLPGLQITPNIEFGSKRWLQNTFATTLYYRGGDFFIAGVKASYQLLDNLQIDAGVRNLTDANYEIENGYHTAGRSFFTDARVSF